MLLRCPNKSLENKKHIHKAKITKQAVIIQVFATAVVSIDLTQLSLRHKLHYALFNWDWRGMK